MLKDSVDPDQLASDMDLLNFQKCTGMLIVRSCKSNTLLMFFHILALSQTSSGV